MGSAGWNGYLAGFHAEHPAITETVLDGSRDRDGHGPYDWVANAVPSGGVIVDVACGSGPLAARTGHGWIGVDSASPELALAARAAPGQVVRADAAAIPLRTGVADSVVCSMALMIFDEPAAVVAEMIRLLRPGGTLVVLLPAARPLTLRDRWRYARLLWALRLRSLPFRHRRVLARPRQVLESGGLRIERLERRRFAYPLTGDGDGHRFVHSLYLPGVDASRRSRATGTLNRWTGSNIGVPLHLVVAVKPPPVGLRRRR